MTTGRSNGPPVALRSTIGMAILALMASVGQAQRVPLEAPALREIPHAPTQSRALYDSARKATIRYAVNGSIVRAGDDFDVAWSDAAGRRIAVRYVPRTRVRVRVEASVSYDSASARYLYRYTFDVDSVSRQPLQSVYLQAMAPGRGTSPDSQWYGRRLSTYLRQSLGVADGWAWSFVADDDGAPAGSRVTGFTLSSTYPPGIVRVVAAGAAPLTTTPEDMPDELHAALQGVAWQLPAGFTVGPVAGPESDIDQFASLIRDLGVALKQGWISAGPHAAALRQQLEDGEGKSRDGRRAEAGAVVDALLRELTGPELHLALPEFRTLMEHRLAILKHTLAAGRAENRRP